MLARFLQDADVPGGLRSAPLAAAPLLLFSYSGQRRGSTYDALGYIRTVSMSAFAAGGPEITQITESKYDNAGGIKKPDIVIPPLPAGGLVIGPMEPTQSAGTWTPQ